ncbi:MAG: disulfide bond formation protein B [Geminicoccaceae bacterium]
MSAALTPRTASLLLAIAAAAILAAVFAFQYLAGAAPCPLCIWQRYPYGVLIVLGVIGFCWQPRPMLVLCALVLLVGAGLAGYHYGVEQGWFALPAGCAAGGDATSIEELRRMLREAPPACDQVQFDVFGWSLAAWNFLASLGLAAFAGAAATRG